MIALCSMGKKNAELGMPLALPITLFVVCNRGREHLRANARQVTTKPRPVSEQELDRILQEHGQVAILTPPVSLIA